MVIPLSLPRARPEPGSTAASEPAPADLVTGARRGDRSAFAELYRQHVRMVHGLLLARVPRGDVNDLVQEVLLTAMRRLDSLRDPAAFPAGSRRSPATTPSTTCRNGAAPAELPKNLAARDSDGDAARAALEAVRSLPKAYRETLVLRLVEGLTGPEIAARTGLTEGSVRVNLHRGIKMLRVRLGVTSDV